MTYLPEAEIRASIIISFKPLGLEKSLEKILRVL
jgi:hypothetical protein